MLGWIIPEPLAIPPIATVFPPISHETATSLRTVSAVSYTHLDVYKRQRQQYGVDDSVSVIALTGSSAKADEVALFEAKDETAAGEIVNLLKNHIEKQKNDYASYAPNEVPKLDNAVLLQNGKYVALCITSDYKTAESTIQESFK